MAFIFNFPYEPDAAYREKVAYFCMEFAIHQPLKTYAGGLGFLAGSHMRAAFELKQHLVGIGILWKYGYYDQVRKDEQTMEAVFREKHYFFLQPTGIQFSITIAAHPVAVTAYYLPPEIFNTAPVFFLSTDIPENDFLARTICHKLYDSNPETSMAAAILLGDGGAKLLEALNWVPQVYHLNESHALPLAFNLLNKFGSLTEVQKRLRFTNHTPEPGGNEKNNLLQMGKMGSFCGVSIETAKAVAVIDNETLDHTLTALRMAGRANAVSGLHHRVLCATGNSRAGACDIISITNAQCFSYWADREMYAALQAGDNASLVTRKKACKKRLFEEIADQEGKIFDENILTIVFAKRIGGYKRADLLLNNMDRFRELISNKQYPVQIVWAGKPYPMDYPAIALFDKIMNITAAYPNCAVLPGYEMKLSMLLKKGADLWLNVPRITHEASGTSGMSAAMNGAINLSIPDGWFPEFAKHRENCFVIPAASPDLPVFTQDEADAGSLYELLEKDICKMYYKDHDQWLAMIKQSMNDIIPQFESKRMAREYYEKLYAE